MDEVLGSDVGHGIYKQPSMLWRSCCSALLHYVLAKEHRSNIFGVCCRSPIGHWGDKMLMELSNTFLSNKLVTSIHL